MLRPTYLGAFALAAMFILADACSAGTSATNAARRGIEVALAARAQARQSRNLNTYMATFTPDWVTVNVIGKVVNFVTLRRASSAEFSHAATMGMIRSDITHLTASRNTAQVMINTHYDFPAQKAPSGLVYPYKDTVASETWVRGSSGWQEKRERYLVDTGGIAAKPIMFSNRILPRL